MLRVDYITTGLDCLKNRIEDLRDGEFKDGLTYERDRLLSETNFRIPIESQMNMNIGDYMRYGDDALFKWNRL